MDKWYAKGAVKGLSVLLVWSFAAAAVSAGTGVPNADVLSGRSFSDYVPFGIRYPDQQRSFISVAAYSMSDLKSAGLEGADLNPASFDELLMAGTNPPAGVERDATGPAATVQRDPGGAGISDPLLMLLAAAGLVIYQLYRKQRSLEQRPLSIA